MIELWVLYVCATSGVAPGCAVMETFDKLWMCEAKIDWWEEANMYDTLNCLPVMPEPAKLVGVWL